MTVHEGSGIIDALTNLCRDMDIKCLIQIGAHDGYEASQIQQTIGCRAIAIEGNTACKPCSNGPLEYHYQIIGATDCMVDFYSHKDAALSSQFPRKDNHEELYLLPQRRLDTFCAEHGAVRTTPTSYLGKAFHPALRFLAEHWEWTWVEKCLGRMSVTVDHIAPDALIIDTEGTTLDVLEGCGTLLDNVKMVYAEVQHVHMRQGIRILPEVDNFLAIRGFTRHFGQPSYTAGEQSNITWVRK